MAYAKDLIGKRFGRLIVVDRNYERQQKVYEAKKYQTAFWDCICDCGNEITVSGSNLRTGGTVSCGCYRNERIHEQKNTKEIQWLFDNDVAIGISNSGKEFIIDLEDYDKVKNYCWRITPQGYVVANSRNGSNRIVWIHRLIMNAKDDEVVDHINWDKLNNRKSNLRIATKSQNNINIRLKSNNTVGYPGITINKSGNYVARISKNNVRYYLGTFKTYKEAIEARRAAEINLHGEWSGENNKNDFEKIISNINSFSDIEEAEDMGESE